MLTFQDDSGRDPILGRHGPELGWANTISIIAEVTW